MTVFYSQVITTHMFDFKGLVNAILRKKNGDPVGSLKSATIWVQELPHSDIHQAQAEIVKALASVTANQKTPLKEKIRVVMYLDEKAAALQKTLCSDYLDNMENPDAPERRFLQTILAFWEGMAAGYQTCIRAFAENPSPKLWPLLPLLTARAIHYHAMQAKWSHLRYLPVAHQVWRNLHRLYLFAERENFDLTPLRLYPDAQEETTCLGKYMQALMLDLANPASLLPAQIDLVDHWLDHWAQSLVLEQQFRPHRQLYAVNLGDTQPGKKLRRNMVGEKYRYWGIGLLTVAIDKIIEQLKNGETPARLKLGENCRLPACLELIELVVTRWSGKGTTRKHERKTSIRPMQVAQGLAEIVAQLNPRAKMPRPAPAGTGAHRKTVDYHLSEVGGNSPAQNVPGGSDEELFELPRQEWIMENESASGYGATFHANGKNALKIGTLIGLKPESGKHLAIGIVRRINKDAHNKIQVGIQTLSQTPIPVELHAAADKPLSAIYLPETAQAQTGRSLLLTCQAYEKGNLMQLKAQEKSYTIRLQQALEQSDDYVRVNFDVVAKQ